MPSINSGGSLPENKYFYSSLLREIGDCYKIIILYYNKLYNNKKSFHYLVYYSLADNRLWVLVVNNK